jgi:hypothetical protein
MALLKQLSLGINQLKNANLAGVSKRLKKCCFNKVV